MIKRTLALTIILAAALPGSAYASAYVATPGSQIAQGGLQSNVSAATFAIRAEANRSYACTAVVWDNDSNLALTGGGADTGGVQRNCGDITPAVGVPSSDTNPADNRLCVWRGTTGSYAIGIGSEASGGEAARVECAETTLYGGYNTNANPINFLEISNLTNSLIRVKVFAKNWNGDMVINGQENDIQAGRRFDIDLHSPAGAGKYGMVWIAHNGPYGAIQATVSQYSSSLAQQSSVPLKPRDQNL